MGMGGVKKKARPVTGADFYFLNGHRLPRLHREEIKPFFRVASAKNFLGKISRRAREAEPLGPK